MWGIVLSSGHMIAGLLLHLLLLVLLEVHHVLRRYVHGLLLTELNWHTLEIIALLVEEGVRTAHLLLTLGIERVL